MTLATYVLIMVNTFNLLVSFRQRTSQTENVNSQRENLFGLDPINLAENQFSVAISPTVEIPQNMGSWKASIMF